MHKNIHHDKYQIASIFLGGEWGGGGADTFFLTLLFTYHFDVFQSLGAY